MSASKIVIYTMRERYETQRGRRQKLRNSIATTAAGGRGLGGQGPTQDDQPEAEHRTTGKERPQYS